MPLRYCRHHAIAAAMLLHCLEMMEEGSDMEPQKFKCKIHTYLLVGPGRYSGPISSTLEILITPILTSPVNSEGTIMFNAPKLV